MVRPQGLVKMVLFSLAFAFFAIGLARPQIGAKLSEQTTHGAEIVICLDVSNSMLAEDYSPNRLDRAKLAISRLTDKLKDDRIGLIIFAGTSFVQLPVTTDYVSAKMFLGSIDTGSVPVQGTAMGDAIYTAIKSFSAQSEKSRVIMSSPTARTTRTTPWPPRRKPLRTASGCTPWAWAPPRDSPSRTRAP